MEGRHEFHKTWGAILCLVCTLALLLLPLTLLSRKSDLRPRTILVLPPAAAGYVENEALPEENSRKKKEEKEPTSVASAERSGLGEGLTTMTKESRNFGLQVLFRLNQCLAVGTKPALVDRSGRQI